MGSGCTGVNEGGGVPTREVSQEPSLHGKSIKRILPEPDITEGSISCRKSARGGISHI